MGWGGKTFPRAAKALAPPLVSGHVHCQCGTILEMVPDRVIVTTDNRCWGKGKLLFKSDLLLLLLQLHVEKSN